MTSAADSLQIRLFGRGAHGSMPEASIDPVVMAASTVMRLQTIVSREVAPTDSAVVYDKAKKDGTLNSLPTNHNPRFAPVIHPTLETGVKALVVAAYAWLAS